MQRIIYLTFLCLVAIQASYAKPIADGVVAVVNQTVITHLDLDKRFELTLRQIKTEKKLSKPQKDAIYKRTLGMLIDEEIEKQFAEKSGIFVDKKDIIQAIMYIEKQNGMKPGEFAKLTKGLEAIASQKLAAEVRRQKIVAQMIRPRIVVSTLEVDRLIEDMLDSSHVLEREVSHIFIRATDDEEDTRKKIARIHTELKNGALFSDLAKAYNEDNSATRGGYLGWFATGEMAVALESVLKDMQPDTFSRPIRSPLGWHIVQLNRTRETAKISMQPEKLLQLYQIIAPVDQKSLLLNLKNNTSSPEDVAAFIATKKDDPLFTGTSFLGWLKEKDLAPNIAKTLKTLQKGSFTDLVEYNGKIRLLYIANIRQVISEKLKTYRERVRKHLEDSRVELASRRFLRDLKRKAFVDVRFK